MKATLFALFFGLLMVGCGDGDSKITDDSTTQEKIIAKAVDKLDDPATLMKLIAGAVDRRNLNYSDKHGEELLYLLDTDTPYTGWTKLMHKNGQVSTLAQIKNGKSDGPVVSWYENGKKEGEGYFEDGVMEGVWTSWYKNGQKSEVANWKDGKKDGLTTRWDDNGQKRFETKYIGGKICKVFETKRIKATRSQISALVLALERYKSEMHDYPYTDDLSSNDEEARGILLFQALSDLVDRTGRKIAPAERGRSFIPKKESFAYGSIEEGRVQVVTLSQLEGVQFPDVFFLDPWGNPYVYEYPRRSGHPGFLLFSKGPDGESSVFDSELTATPEKTDVDLDNIPSTEPGKW